jgi:hypothetical protein
MNRPIYLLILLTLCSCKPKHDKYTLLDIHTTIKEYDCHVGYVDINPSVITPFLGETNQEEVALKHFMSNLDRVQIFALSDKDMHDGLTAKIRQVGYTLVWERERHRQRIEVFADVEKERIQGSLFIFASQEDEYYYCLDMQGYMSISQIHLLSIITPAFYAQYFKRFQFDF